MHATPPPARPSRRRLLAAALAGWAAGGARAGGFPQQPVRLVVPHAVGIGPDVVARGVAEQLQRRWSQPVLVDDKPGASGIVAFGDVRRAPADGHVLYLADTATMVVHPLLHAQLPYDPGADLAPLSLLFRATFLLFTGGPNPHRTGRLRTDAIHAAADARTHRGRPRGRQAADRRRPDRPALSPGEPACS